MPASPVETLIVQRPKVQAAPEVANKPPQPPVSQKNGEQFAPGRTEHAGKSRSDPLPERRISRHTAAGRGELIAGDYAAADWCGRKATAS
jgi:hypothetical protein